MRWLQKYEQPIYALLRVVAGFLFFCHGAQKVLGFFGGHGGGGLPPLMMVGGWIELVGGALIALGLFGAIAAFIASGEMAVAYFKAHAPGGFWPIANHGELAVLYCFVFLYIAAHGSGPYSVDALLARRRR
ncbi:MAG TPA: DoxX family protein [Thermoanaerobaculia bacterium]|nr:DoxX family protein [Thermoanaerobaculia bacterium]